MKILLINQNATVEKLVRLSAQRIGLELSAASIATDAQAGEYAWVLIDNDSLGGASIESLRQKYPGAKIGLLHPKTVARISGFDLYIEKPFLPTELIEEMSSKNETATADLGELPSLDDVGGLPSFDDAGEENGLNGFGNLDEIDLNTLQTPTTTNAEVLADIAAQSFSAQSFNDALGDLSVELPADHADLSADLPADDSFGAIDSAASDLAPADDLLSLDDLPSVENAPVSVEEKAIDDLADFDGETGADLGADLSPDLSDQNSAPQDVKTSVLDEEEILKVKESLSEEDLGAGDLSAGDFGEDLLAQPIILDEPVLDSPAEIGAEFAASDEPVFDDPVFNDPALTQELAEASLDAFDLSEPPLADLPQETLKTFDEAYDLKLDLGENSALLDEDELADLHKDKNDADDSAALDLAINDMAADSFEPQPQSFDGDDALGSLSEQSVAIALGEELPQTAGFGELSGLSAMSDDLQDTSDDFLRDDILDDAPPTSLIQSSDLANALASLPVGTLRELLNGMQLTINISFPDKKA